MGAAQAATRREMDGAEEWLLRVMDRQVPCGGGARVTRDTLGSRGSNGPSRGGPEAGSPAPRPQEWTQKQGVRGGVAKGKSLEGPGV